jgi:hypothetical protein
MKFLSNRKWDIPEDWSDIWTPLTLLDRITGNRMKIPYKAGSARYGMAPMSIESEFEGAKKPR